MSDAKLTVDTIAELQAEVATQREVICNLNAMNDELQAKLDKIEQVVDDYLSDNKEVYYDTEVYMDNIIDVVKE
jgi:uncharacterized coiled-coil protein SlyX